VKPGTAMPNLNLSDDVRAALVVATGLTRRRRRLAMKYQSQRIAYLFFATCMLLLTLQIIYGFIMGFAHMGYDGCTTWIPFNAARATHTNLLVVWLLAGFMGAATTSSPRRPSASCSAQAGHRPVGLAGLVGVVAIIGFHSTGGRAASSSRSRARSTTWWSSTC
jgi:nitric oxide reductase large subunit